MKSSKLIIIAALILVLAVPAGAQQSSPFSVESAAAVLLDYDSGQVLFSQDGRLEHIPASLVKVMTMYVALDQIAAGRVSLEDTTTVSEQAWRMSGSQMFLEVGEVVTIEQLLYGIAVVSGNDACVALAEALAGTEELYVRWMNEKAAELGLNLHFADVHGLSESNSITAEDMAVLVRSYLQQHPQALQYHKERSFSYQPRSQKKPIVQYNRNGLLNSFEGADGLKTGHLSAAGYNLIGTAVQNGRRLIAVVLGAESEVAREQEAAKLLNYGYRSFDLVDSGRFLEDKTVPVYKGRVRQVNVVAQEPLLTIPRGIQTGLDVSLQTKQLLAPVEKGQVVGTLTVRYEGEVLKQTSLLASDNVPRGGFWRVLVDSISLFFRRLIRRP